MHGGCGPEAPSIILARFMNATLLRLKDANGEYMLDMLYGFTPKRNQLAIKRMQLTGVVIQGKSRTAHGSPIRGKARTPYSPPSPAKARRKHG